MRLLGFTNRLEHKPDLVPLAAVLAMLAFGVFGKFNRQLGDRGGPIWLLNRYLGCFGRRCPVIGDSGPVALLAFLGACLPR